VNADSSILRSAACGFAKRFFPHHLLVVAAIAAIPLLSIAADPATQPASRPRLGKIVFCSDRGGGAWRIWVMSEDGSQPKQLSQPAKDAAGGEEEASDVDPAFRPDGAEILFTSTRGGKAGVWRMQADGAKPQRICDGDQADWSPAGKSICFRRAGRIVIRELAGGKEQFATPEDFAKCSGPAWSPDGKRIAFALLGETGNALYVTAAPAGPAAAPAKPTLVFGDKGACEPRWSPDGQRLVYETETHLYTIAPDGTKNRMITWNGGLQRYAQWSPDGKQVVFCQGASPTGPWELYTAPAAGGAPKRLTQGGSDMYPDWK
jgi:Tol biopolymer transport system component